MGSPSICGHRGMYRSGSQIGDQGTILPHGHYSCTVSTSEQTNVQYQGLCILGHPGGMRGSDRSLRLRGLGARKALVITEGSVRLGYPGSDGIGSTLSLV